jgi:hypothetical protein
VNWFRQNPWLGLFLAVFGGLVLLALGFVWWTRAGLATATARFDESLKELSRLERLDPFPNDANYDKLKVHLDNYSATLDKVKDELKTRMLPVAPLAPNEFQARLRQVTLAAAERARTNKVKLPPGFHMGFDEYTATLPNNTAAPLLGQELSQINLLIGYVIDAHVDSLINLRRTPLPEERAAAAGTATPTPTLKPAQQQTGSAAAGPRVIDRNIVDLTFVGPSAAARRVLNQIASSSQQFYIVRTLYVRNEKATGPPREEPGKVQPSPTPAGALNFIVGNEHIQVSARIEMLRFNF